MFSASLKRCPELVDHYTRFDKLSGRIDLPTEAFPEPVEAFPEPAEAFPELVEGGRCQWPLILTPHARPSFYTSASATTVDKTLPAEIAYRQRHGAFNGFVSQHLDMPSATLNLLVRFLESGNGQLSKRAREKEFTALTSKEIAMLEDAWQQAFQHDGQH